VKLNAKENLAGQTRKCPKCGETLQIPESDDPAAVAAEPAADDWDGLEEAPSDQHVHDALDHDLATFEAPKRLTHLSRYLICDKSKIFAKWEDNGQGWMLKTNAGFVSARRNPEKLPSQGNYTLVELVMEMSDEGLRLRGIRTYQIAQRWALTVLDQGDHLVLKKVVGPGSLNKEQKAAVRKFLGDEFMRPIWGEAAEVLEYLGNFDYHSQGAG
jgi:hypothetical protein